MTFQRLRMVLSWFSSAGDGISVNQKAMIGGTSDPNNWKTKILWKDFPGPAKVWSLLYPTHVNPVSLYVFGPCSHKSQKAWSLPNWA